MSSLTTNKTRGSDSGRPIMVLFDILGQRWTLRILWELRHGRQVFRELRSLCDDISPTLLNNRLKALRELQLIDHQKQGYGYTEWGQQLSLHLTSLDQWSRGWGESVKATGDNEPPPTASSSD